MLQGFNRFLLPAQILFFCLAMNAALTKPDTTLILATGQGLLLVRLYDGSMHERSLNGLPANKFHLEQVKTGQRD